MRKTIYTVSILLFSMSGANAQTMTYNHDASKQAQIEVMEVGAGSLTPELYYKVTHHNYWEGAKATTSVKNTLRLAANAASIPQVEYADSIQADLEDRAKIEAANIADRQIDLAWVTEGNKIENRLLRFKNNINALSGKTGRGAVMRLRPGGSWARCMTLPSKSPVMPICPTASVKSSTWPSTMRLSKATTACC